MASTEFDEDDFDDDAAAKNLEHLFNAKMLETTFDSVQGAELMQQLQALLDCDDN